MAENKNFNSDEVEVIESAIATELTKNDDIIEYIQPSNLERLKARYAAIEEDESIRNEGFELAKKKQRPEGNAFDYLAAPVNPRDEIRTDVNSPLSRVFNETRSEFDADIASFADITVNAPKPVVKEEEKPEPPTEPPKRKRGRPRKNPVVPVEEKKEEPAPTEPPPTINNRYGFDTHTRVIYIDESADDGIKRNSEEELFQAFTDDMITKKRRLFPWSRKKK
ncbi:MAG: hypothetical protein J6A67_06730 [Clostridia bacterium]|nr:hypothetical protein [Clostridia bacterium]